jgi:hypothetical protein
MDEKYRYRTPLCEFEGASGIQMIQLAPRRDSRDPREAREG